MKLHLGAKNLVEIPKASWKILSEGGWVHLGTHKPEDSQISTHNVWKNAELIPWYYKKGDKLPLKGRTFYFVYSEHFFEHLFLDEAVSLFKELYSVMERNSVCRTVVPDADLRTYEPPEPVGYPGSSLGWNYPEKHKTRWSYNMMSEVLKIAGFDAVIGLVYCTPEGEFVNMKPCDFEDSYEGCIEKQIIFDTSYISRPRSLIVDAIKR